jgi:formamidopyrimidine-DNA glycosylase
MPELPEVETIARCLREGDAKYHTTLIGCRVVGVEVLWARTLAKLTPDEFAKRIQGQAIRSVGRRGKFLVIRLSTDTLLVHLRMSGDLRLETALDSHGTQVPLQKHDRLSLVFDCWQRLVFNDTRKFGRVWLTEDPKTVLGSLGPEPLEPQLTDSQFFSMLSHHKRQLKPLLMDQSFLAGLGNIYTDEALHLAKLHPCMPSDQVSPQASIRLLAAIRSVLQEGIRRNGASIDWVYRGGDFQNHLRVYGRSGQPCPVCGTPVTRLVVGQRGTHICPACQPAP